MSLEFFGHKFSSFTQKALIALYENGTPFVFRELSPEHPENGAEWERLWPLKRFPIIREGDELVVEATSCIEYLEARHPGPVRLIPTDPAEAIRVRMMDRVFDNYVSTPQQTIIFNAIRAEGDRDPYGDAQARQMLENAYAWLDGALTGRTWACGSTFTMADAAAAPALFYADWTHEIPGRFRTLKDYRARLLARPSFARCVDEARPYRPFFPLGAPDRD
jgi:glutathione S-transferase